MGNTKTTASTPQTGPLPAVALEGHEIIIYEDARCSADRPFAVIEQAPGGFHILMMHTGHSRETKQPIAWALMPKVIAALGEGHFRDDTWAWRLVSTGTGGRLRRAASEARENVRRALM